MSYSPILAPVTALLLWSCVIFAWLYATRIPAMRRAGISLKGRVGTRGSSLDGVVPDRVQWVSHNYNHLMEQPTIFYAVAIAAAMIGRGDGLNLWLAWIYVGLRIVHSLIQVTTNRVKYRGSVFGLMALVLVLLTAHLLFHLAYDFSIRA